MLTTTSRVEERTVLIDASVGVDDGQMMCWSFHLNQ